MREFNDYEFRGAFMTIFIDIEWLLSDCISMLLVGENELQLDLMEFITPKYMLDQKVSLLSQILKSRHKDTYNVYKSDLEELRKFRKLRNNFAHKKIELDNKNQRLHFLQVLNHRIDKSINHSFDELNDLWEKLKEILKRMKSLIDEVVRLKST
ncbi:MAG: hypothetical protein RLO81_11510 [Fulvivirga sp.]|uniref:hypothetical protein n=1 Tax=Fulvivirga sp. TaxID=1931237 RepID=UPI0032EF30E9